jgi:uncharacterized membrane protein
MHVSDIVPAGWIHAVACLVALAAGAWNIALPKGTSTHRAMGRVYMTSMIVLNVSAFFIFSFDIASFSPFRAGPHVFGLFHWFAVAALVLIAIGWYAARRQDRAFWAYVHPTMMLLSYYDLVGGGINDAFTRVNPLRAILVESAKSVGPHRQPPVIGMTQTLWMALIIVLLVYFVARVARLRRQSRIRAQA